ncbi:MAG: ABC transporter ATP-binding protein [Pseudomonadota bacterium]
MTPAIFSWFERRLEPYPSEAPRQPPAGLMAFCAHYTRGAWPALILMAVLTAVIAAGEVYLFALLGQLVDWLVDRDRATIWSEEGGTFVLIGLLVGVGLPVLVALQRMIIHQTLLGNYPMRIRWESHRYILGQSFGFYQNEFAGRVATKVMQTSLAVREVVMTMLDVVNYVGVYFLGMLVLVGSFDPVMLIPFVLWLIAYVTMLRFFLPRLQEVSKQQADARSIMTGRIVDSYTNIATVKLFAESRRENAYAKESMDGFLDTVYEQMRWVSHLGVLLYTTNSILVVSVAGLAIYQWSVSAMTVGMIAAAVGLSLRLNGISQWIMWEMSRLFENIGTVEDGITMLTRNREVLDKPNAQPLAVTEAGIRFEGVSFNYGKDEDDERGSVIEGLSLDVKPGEKIGLVGRSGAGKSTLVNLLLRFYDLSGGQILVDGQSVSNVQQESLRGHMGVVTQDTSLLHRSVRDNLLYGRPNATEEQMIAAAKQAEAHDFILDLEDMEGRKGYDAHVGERGVKLSGGQRQRIAIARVILKDAPILLLDEATSALDSEVEAAIQSSLYGLMEGKTVIAIAHRLSTIAQLDRLIVLDDGKIIESGTHDELIQAGGLYQQLWERQSGGFLAVPDDEFEAAQ